MFSAILVVASAARAGVLDCSAAATAEEFVQCYRTALIRTGEVPQPTEGQRSAWRDAVDGMLGGDCSPLGPPLALAAVRYLWQESSSQRSFCVMHDVADADDGGMLDLGWGLVMVNPRATRQLCHQAPHPIADLGTEALAVSAFQATDSRCLMIAGTKRDTGTILAPCQGLLAADVAHNDATLFHAATEALAGSDAGAGILVLQWHGMADATCPPVDVYIAEGLTTTPRPESPAWTLASTIAAREPLWRTGVAGSGLCSLNGTRDVQLRLLNGVDRASVCTTAATGSSSRALHIELAPAFRESAPWISILAAAWPSDAGGGSVDAGSVDAGPVDAGPVDAGTAQAPPGEPTPPRSLTVGCQLAGQGASAATFLLVLCAFARRRRRRS